MSDNNITTYPLDITYDGATAAEIDALTRHLQQELLSSSDVYDATLPASQAPVEAGAKSIGEVTIGQILLATLPVALPAVIAALQAWHARQRDRQMISLKIGDNEMTIPYDADPETVQQLADILRAES